VTANDRPTGPVTVTMERLEQLVVLASTAGAAAMRFYAHEIEVTHKADSSPLTAADQAANEIIVSELARWDPGIPIISEEAALPDYAERRTWRRFWLVDPLDGTKEFIARNGQFTVNIALIEGTEPVMGVVVAPALAEVYFAGKGLGAWKRTADGATVRLRTTPRTTGPTRIVESRSHPSPRLEEFIATLGPVERLQVGSSLKFCRVAEGAADLYPRFGRTMEWDVAAGDCVYRHSGVDGGGERPSPLSYNQPALSSSEFVIGTRPHDPSATA
jgi:3'(2'), 5'-bisphosphate nucleotidase